MLIKISLLQIITVLSILTLTLSQLKDDFKPFITYDEEFLREKLDDQSFYLTQYEIVEILGTGIYDQHFEPGVYNCIVCDEELFNSWHKYDVNHG